MGEPEELLNPNCYPDLFAARTAAQEWLIDYNDLRIAPSDT